MCGLARPGETPPAGPFHITLTFDRSVDGPICLGWGSHFGFGLFVPADDGRFGEGILGKVRPEVREYLILHAAQIEPDGERAVHVVCPADHARHLTAARASAAQAATASGPRPRAPSFVFRCPVLTAHTQPTGQLNSAFLALSHRETLLQKSSFPWAGSKSKIVPAHDNQLLHSILNRLSFARPSLR